MVQPLQHLQFIVNHLFVALDILLQDDLDGNFLTLKVCFSNDSVGTSTQGSAELVLRFLIV